MRPLCLRRLWLPVLLLLVLAWMPKEQCYGCKKSYADLSNHLAKCKKAVDFVDGGLRLRIDKQTEKSRLREAKKQRKVDKKRAKADEAKERLAVRRAQLEVCHRDSLSPTHIFRPHICRLNGRPACL